MEGRELINKLAWIHLPPELQQQVIRALTRLLAQALKTPTRREGRHEPQ
jgi:hypothetical protein